VDLVVAAELPVLLAVQEILRLLHHLKEITVLLDRLVLEAVAAAVQALPGLAETVGPVPTALSLAPLLVMRVVVPLIQLQAGATRRKVAVAWSEEF
jgi:hypothetical protein